MQEPRPVLFSALTVLFDIYDRLVTERLELEEIKRAFPDFQAPQILRLIAQEREIIDWIQLELEEVHNGLSQRKQDLFRLRSV